HHRLERFGSGQLDDAEGGEPWLAFRQRCVEALEALGTRWRGQRVVVFTHGGVMRHWFAHVVGLPPETTRFAFSTTNASVSELRLGDRGWWIHTWGHHDHLKDLGYLSW
ncbi:MAG: histidine phosphatase family protein, partial [Myxococcota bacterium]